MNYLLGLAIVLLSSSAWASSAAPGQGGSLMTFVPLIAIAVIFYFLLIRPQQKQAKEHQRMVNELKRGDRVLTQGGLYGTVHAVKGKVIELKISEETKVLVGKSFVTQVLQNDPSLEVEVVSNGAAKG
ncbi:MAG: preprotein translocase subunit YajC [Elusimicrobia bacterium]|nr:preprotein translocase subunit YajC [Elusimicrobiota bacterium]MBP9127437.1 preprotein translocase subunit YajC [Elusimicrobiota bacterium]MBP9698851.1 preprotein translocase subunit YajC [Elusimicrobiota bacterium]